MKKIIIAASTLAMTLASAVAMSKCPANLDAEMLMECITVEGSGRNYQDWRKQYEQAMASEQADQQAKQPGSDKSVVAN